MHSRAEALAYYDFNNRANSEMKCLPAFPKGTRNSSSATHVIIAVEITWWRLLHLDSSMWKLEWPLGLGLVVEQEYRELIHISDW